jgi:membrane fusion protein (multidrug efflux system)
MNTHARLEAETEIEAPFDVRRRFPARRLKRALRRWKKPLLFGSVPLLIAVGGAGMWFASLGVESTDNAYVQQNVVGIAPEVVGTIVEVAVRENQQVKAGDLLFRIDDTPYRIAVANAEAQLADTRIKVAQLHSELNARVADAGAKGADVDLARENLARQTELLKRGFTTRAAYEEAVRALNASQQERASASADVVSARDALTAAGPGTHPLILAAQAALDKARLDLKRTVVRAPQDGVISQTDRLQLGAQALAYTPQVTLVASGDSWVEANFKETQLRDMRVGQKAKVEIDAFDARNYPAVITGIGAGTGSQFSILPAQNATGNWIKVVQRVPVRLRLLEKPDQPLAAGLSATVTVDTSR